MMSCETLVGRPRVPESSAAEGPVTFTDVESVTLVTSACAFRHSTHHAHPLTAALVLELDEHSDTRLDASAEYALELLLAFA